MRDKTPQLHMAPPHARFKPGACLEAQHMFFWRFAGFKTGSCAWFRLFWVCNNAVTSVVEVRISHGFWGLDVICHDVRPDAFSRCHLS